MHEWVRAIPTYWQVRVRQTSVKRQLGVGSKHCNRLENPRLPCPRKRVGVGVEEPNGKHMDTREDGGASCTDEPISRAMRLMQRQGVLAHWCGFLALSSLPHPQMSPSLIVLCMFQLSCVCAGNVQNVSSVNACKKNNTRSRISLEILAKKFEKETRPDVPGVAGWYVSAISF